MPLPRPVPYFRQQIKRDGVSIDDPNGCWYACAKMMGVYWEGNYFLERKGVPALNNADGTHGALGGDDVATLRTNERLQTVDVRTPMSTPEQIDAALTSSGPIIFSWWAPGPDGFTYHMSVIVGVMGRDIVFHDPDMDANQTMSIDRMSALRTGPDGRRDSMMVRDPKTIPPKVVEIIEAKSVSYKSASGKK